MDAAKEVLRIEDDERKGLMLACLAGRMDAETKAGYGELEPEDMPEKDLELPVLEAKRCLQQILGWQWEPFTKSAYCEWFHDLITGVLKDAYKLGAQRANMNRTLSDIKRMDAAQTGFLHGIVEHIRFVEERDAVAEPTAEGDVP